MIIPIFAVNDVAVSSRFYTENLEFGEMFQMPGENGPMFAMVALTPGANIGLSRQDAPEPKGSGSVIMVYVADDTDIDAYYERVKARGTEITQEIRDEYWGDRAFAVKDPDGFFIQLCKCIRQVTSEEMIAAQAGQG